MLLCSPNRCYMSFLSTIPSFGNYQLPGPFRTHLAACAQDCKPHSQCVNTPLCLQRVRHFGNGADGHVPPLVLKEDIVPCRRQFYNPGHARKAEQSALGTNTSPLAVWHSFRGDGTSYKRLKKTLEFCRVLGREICLQ